MSERSLRCPFCGGYALITAAGVRSGVGDELVFHGVAECTSCWCRLTTPEPRYSVAQARAAVSRLWCNRYQESTP